MNWRLRPDGFSRGALAWLGGVAVLLLMGLLVAPVIIMGGSALLLETGSGCASVQGGSGTQPAVSTAASNSIPANYLALFQAAGKKYGVPWVILAGIGKVESDFGRSNLPGVHSGANAFGAAGPMQIGIGGAAGNQWGGAPVHPASEPVNGVATDGDGDGIASVYDPADAIAGAAKYLVGHGVQDDPAGAIFAYNHSESYVDLVLSYAAQYAAGGYSVSAVSAANVPDCEPGANLAASQVGGTGQVPNQTVATAITFAQAQLGKPYQFGATGPDAYDCSGLVMMAYRAAGVYIPRTSQEQWSYGPQVPAGGVEPGDLVFFAGADGTSTAPGHVGLVVDPATHLMIDAYQTGTPVRYDTYGLPSSAGGLSDPIGFTRPWDHAPAQQ